MAERGAVTRPEPIGVAVIGAGMAGRAHAAAYRTAATLYGLDRPAVRLVAVADPNRPLIVVPAIPCPAVLRIALGA